MKSNTGAHHMQKQNNPGGKSALICLSLYAFLVSREEPAVCNSYNYETKVRHSYIQASDAIMQYEEIRQGCYL